MIMADKYPRSLGEENAVKDFQNWCYDTHDEDCTNCPLKAKSKSRTDCLRLWLGSTEEELEPLEVEADDEDEDEGFECED